MKHTGPRTLGQQSVEHARVIEISNDELGTGQHGRGVASRKIVQNDAFGAALQLIRDQMAADITSATGDQVLGLHAGVALGI